MNENKVDLSEAPAWLELPHKQEYWSTTGRDIVVKKNGGSEISLGLVGCACITPPRMPKPMRQRSLGECGYGMDDQLRHTLWLKQ